MSKTPTKSDRVRLSEEAKLRMDYEEAKENYLRAVQELNDLFGRMTTSADPMHPGHVKEVFQLGQAVRRIATSYSVQ